MQPEIAVRPLARDSLADFRALLACPPNGWCWCVAWEVDTWDGWSDRTEGENRKLREDLWAKGEYHGYLLYEERKPIAWCRVGPRRVWPKLCRQFSLDPAESVYAFTCFGIAAERRGQGLMHTFLRLALDDLEIRGVRRVEGFPKRSDGELEPGEVWTGPLGLFRAAGFDVLSEFPRSYHVARDLG